MMEIRPLCETDDFSAVGSVFVHSWKRSYQGILPQGFLDKLSPERFSASMRAQPGLTLAALEDGAPVGACSLAFCRQPQREGYGEIVSLYLLPEHTGKGLGRRLLQAALERFRQEGCTDVCLWVFAGNHRAMAFYKRMGFAFSGCRQFDSYAGEKVEMLEMTCSIAE